jgi:hypothetical protein
MIDNLMLYITSGVAYANSSEMLRSSRTMSSRLKFLHAVVHGVRDDPDCSRCVPRFLRHLLASPYIKDKRPPRRLFFCCPVN